MHSIVWGESLLFGKTSLLICCLSLQELVGLFPTICDCILRKRGRLSEILCNRFTSSVVPVKIHLIEMLQAQKFFFGIEFFVVSFFDH